MNGLWKRLKSPWFLLFLSALCSALPFSFPSLYWLSWVSFTPFFYVCLRGGNGRFFSSVGKGVFFGFWYHFFVYYWFLWLYPLDFVGLDKKSASFIVFFAWIGISFLHGALFFIPTLLCHILKKKTQNRPFLLFSASIGILAVQRIQGLSELAFPWVKVSLGQYRESALIQSASLFGMEGLDLLMLLVSSCLALFFCSKEKKRVLFLLMASLIFTANLTFGIVSLKKENASETVTIASVQGCVLSGEKWSSASFSLETYFNLSKTVSDDADLIIWPESAIPVNLSSYPTVLEEICALSHELEKPIFMGCLTDQNSKTANTALLVEGDVLSSPYVKRMLVPFGERMPYRKVLSSVFPELEKINMLSSDLAEGGGTALISWNGKTVGTAICYESIFPHLVRESVQDGAEILFLVTNDSWYEDSPAVWQHLAHSVFRSVENGRATVRCANSGVSAFIDEKGQIQSFLGPLEQGILTDEVSFSSEKTLFTTVGNVTLPVACTIAFIWFVILLSERGRRGKSGK